MSLSQYFDHFLSRHKAAEKLVVWTWQPTVSYLLWAKRNLKNTEESKSKEYKDWLTDVKDHANNQFFVLVFIHQAGDRFKECRRELKNHFAKGTNHLPKTVDDACALLQNYDSAATFNICKIES